MKIMANDSISFVCERIKFKLNNISEYVSKWFNMTYARYEI